MKSLKQIMKHGSCRLSAKEAVVISIIGLIFIGGGVGLYTLSWYEIINKWIGSIALALGLFVGGIFIYRGITLGCVLVAPFLEKEDGEVVFGAYLLDEEAQEYKWVIKPFGMKKKSGWIKKKEENK